MITIYDIASICGVSPSTVSKVINNYDSIPESTKQKVLKAMEDMNYIPNSSAKSLSKGLSNNVGILSFFGTTITPFQHPLFMDVLDSFQNEMNRKRYDLLFVSRMVGGNDGTFYKNCMSRHVDGVLMLGDMNNIEMKEVIESEIPSVGFDYMGTSMSGVCSNNYQLMLELTNHLFDLGHTNIVYIAGDENAITLQRIAAYKKAFELRNIPYDNSKLIQSKYVDFDDISSITDAVLKRKNPPSAIMFPDDYSAARGMAVIKQHGLSCPEDISVTGFDGIELGQLLTPKLTTAKQDAVKIGVALAKKLISEMNSDEKDCQIIEIPGKIIIGESTAKAKMSLEV